MKKNQKEEVKKFMDEFLKNDSIDFLHSEVNINYESYGIRRLQLEIVYEEIKEV